MTTRTRKKPVKKPRGKQKVGKAKEVKKRSYRWRKGFKANVAADVVQAEVVRIQAEHDGACPARVLWKENSDEGDPLFCCFEWDDVEAAAQHRDTQARQLMRNVVFVDESVPDAPVELIVNVSLGDPFAPETGGYRALADILDDPEDRTTLLRRAEAGLRSWLLRFGMLSEAAGETVSRAVQLLTDELNGGEE